jgi:hypothetical protein
MKLINRTELIGIINFACCIAALMLAVWVAIKGDYLLGYHLLLGLFMIEVILTRISFSKVFEEVIDILIENQKKDEQ